MKKSPEKTSAGKIISKVAKITGGAALIAALGFGTAELTGCRPNNKEDLKKIENTTKPDSLAYNHDSPDSLAYSDDVKNYLQLTEEDWNSLSDSDKAGFLQGIVGMKEQDKTSDSLDEVLAEQNGIKKDQNKRIGNLKDSIATYEDYINSNK